MALVSPINPAFPNDVLLSNIVLNGFGQITDLDSDENLYDVHGLRCARALIVVLDQPMKKKIKSIDYSFLYMRFDITQADGNRRIGARIAIFRNYTGNTATDIIDPIFTNRTPQLVNGSGLDWQIQGHKLCDWSQQDLIFNRWISNESKGEISLDLTLGQQEKVAIVITPVYSNGLSLATTTGVAPDFETPANVGTYPGSFGSGFLDSRNHRVLRSLAVFGCYE